MTTSADGGMPQIATDFAAHYNQGREHDRLLSGTGRLEYARTQELLRRFLPTAPARILDIGGGTGVYAFWLASLGYTVHLMDAMPIHIEQARNIAAQPRTPVLASLSVGDACDLAFDDESADAVLLLGPLYHLTERVDRVRALQEAYRVLRPGGVVCAVGISRFASTLDGLMGGLLHDPEFERIVTRDLATGQHRNPGDHPRYFTTAFFHLPEELRSEVGEAGFGTTEVLAVEGPGAMMSFKDFEGFWDADGKREVLLRTIRAVETASSLLGASPHFMAVARKGVI